MSIIWIIEDPAQGLAELTRSMIGNFAVRCIASTKSYYWLSKIEKKHRPDAIIINMDHFSSESKEILSQIAATAVDALIIGMTKGPSRVEAVSKGVFRISDSSDFKYLVTFIKDYCFLAASPTAHVFSFKDVQINMNEFSFRIQPGESFDTLSSLEFRLLRLFLNNPNKCFTRDELINLIWDRVKVASRTVDSQVSRLRKRLTSSECQIESVYGGGYRLI